MPVQTWKEKFQWLIAKLLIRFKRIKQVSFTAKQLNSMLSAQLPESFSINIPGGKGGLTVLKINLSIPPEQNVFNIELFCGFSVKAKGTLIYRTHLFVFVSAVPVYNPSTTAISLSQVNVVDIVLVKDKFSVLRDTRFLMSKLVPSPIKNLLNTTIKASIGVIATTTTNEIAEYFALYLSGSKQLILDYHRKDIEKQLIKLAEQGDLQYKMNADVFEEKIFAALGQEIRVENGLLLFIFH